MGTPLKEFSPSHLDELLGINTYGNNSIIRNKVLLYMPQARFADVVNSVAITIGNSDEFKNLSEFFPWGSIGLNGELKPNDAYQEVGEPIVAVTKVPEDLALASSTAQMGTKVIFVDGARGLANDLQAFDDISEHQKMVILASSEEKEALSLLQDRNCPIWHMSPEEILIGETSIGDRMRSSLVGATIRAGETRRDVKVTVIDCYDDTLQRIAETLENAAELLQSSEDTQEGEQIIRRLYGILFTCSECCFGVGEETKALLRATQDEVKQYRKWLDPVVARKIGEATDQLTRIIEDGTFGEGKTEALLEYLLEEGQGLRVVATRTPRTADNLRVGLEKLGSTIPVLSIPAITLDRDYAGIILPAWPNKRRFTRLKAQAVTSNICILAYPFEKKWVTHFQAWEHKQERSNRMDTEVRSLILGIEPRLITPTLERYRPEPPASGPGLDLPIFRIEDRVATRRIEPPAVAGVGEEGREAQLVRFSGDCYALMTEWSKLPRLNQLIDGTNETKLIFIPVSKLSPGDYVLFRASGNKELVRLVAEEVIGPEKYERRRNLAERWKVSLRRLGTSPIDVQQWLAVYGLKRTPATIGGWLNSEDRIGPQDFRDIKFIAKAARDEELLSIRDDVAEAISYIRKAHIQAGHLLTKLLLGELGGRLDRLDEQPMLLETDFGEAWVVHVQMVEGKRKQYPLNFVNQLRWTEDEGF